MSDNMCRVCLCSDRRMYAISKTVLQEMWEKLTNVQFNTNYGKPCHVCYICCAQLKKCSQLRERALKAEEWLTSFFNNGSKQSQESILSIASMTNDLDSMSFIKELFQFEYKQFNSDTVEYIKRENEEEYEEHDQEENDIKIKEEVDSEEEIKREYEEEYEEHDQEENDIKIKEEDSCQEENLDAFDDEPGTRSDENVPLTSSNILRSEVRIVLEKIDREAPRRNRILNIVQQKTKRSKLEETIEDKNILANAVLNSIPNNNCKPHVPSSSKHLSVCMDVESFEIKPATKSAINCSLENKISLNVNVPPENVIIQNKTPTSRLSHNDVKNVISKQYLQKNADEVASSTRKDGCDQGDTTNVFNRSAPANKFFCHTCQYVCVTERELNTHLCRHTGEKLSLCDNSSSIKYDLKTRVNNGHTKDKNFSCHICQYKCVRKYELSIHLRKHTGEKPYTCDFCEYACSAKKNLQSHLKYKHTKEKKFACTICEYKCVEKKNLNRHLRTHTGEKPYTCDLCKFSCSHKKSLKSHTKHKHTKEKNFACHICEYKCVEKKELNRHLRKHTGEKRYTCDLCDYACLEKASLNNHLKYKHTKEKNFSCDICGYKCVTKGDLNRHLRKHTPDKPFTCDLCEYACLEKCNLKRHLMYKHTKEKNFSCDICGYKFVAKGDLKSHLPIHTAEKPYTCDLCDYACSTKFRLKQHFKCKHTEEKTSPVINVNTNVL